MLQACVLVLQLWHAAVPGLGERGMLVLLPVEELPAWCLLLQLRPQLALQPASSSQLCDLVCSVPCTPQLALPRLRAALLDQEQLVGHRQNSRQAQQHRQALTQDPSSFSSSPALWPCFLVQLQLQPLHWVIL